MDERTEGDGPSDGRDTPEPQAGGAVGGRADPFGTEVTDTEPSGDDVPKTPTGDADDGVDLATEDLGGAGGGTTEDPGRKP
jgi:hypothetical protein